MHRVSSVLAALVLGFGPFTAQTQGASKHEGVVVSDDKTATGSARPTAGGLDRAPDGPVADTDAEKMAKMAAADSAAAAAVTTLGLLEAQRPSPGEPIGPPGTLPIDDNAKRVAKEQCSSAAQGNLTSNNAKAILIHKRACMRLNAGITAGAAGVAGAEIVRSIAQVVATKAQAAGWERLIKELESAAQCENAKGSPTFPATCDVLGSLKIQDLVSSPTVLLNAVVQDLLRDTDQRVSDVYGNDAPIVLNTILSSAVRDWRAAGSAALAQAIRQAILDALLENDRADCNSASTSVDKYEYVVSMCLAQGSWTNLNSCTNAADFIRSCGATPAQRTDVNRLWNLTLAASASKSLSVDWVNLLGGIEQAHLDDQGVEAKNPRRVYLAGTQDLLAGLIAKDWVQATSGAVRIVEELETQRKAKGCQQISKPIDCKEEKENAAAKQSDEVVTFLQLMAAIGNYALTFDSQSKDPAASAAAREKIISDLADRMVHRTERKSGAAISVGGAIGVIGGPRFDSDGKRQAAFPLQLTLGIGLQTYHRSQGVFHLMVSAVDVGQYVSLNDGGNLTVATPDLKAALIVGLTMGYWFTMKETPFYVGAHGSVAPFNRAADHQTFEVGLVTGIYVPLLDIN
jgi:hypothetical protein